MSERVTRINDTKVELKRCTEQELMTIAMEAMKRAEQAEREVQQVAEELQSRHLLATTPMEAVA